MLLCTAGSLFVFMFAFRSGRNRCVWFTFLPDNVLAHSKVYTYSLSNREIFLIAVLHIIDFAYIA